MRGDPLLDREFRAKPDSVSVVLLVRDEIATLPTLLPALFAQDIGEVEILAIDSGSRDGSREFLARNGVPMIDIPPDDFHHSVTRNLGAASARGDLIVWLAADAVPLSRGWLTTLVAPLTDLNIMGAYGRQVARPEHGPLHEFRLGYLYPNRSEVRDSRNVARGDQLAYCFSDVNSCIRRSFWKAHPYPTDVAVAEDAAMARAIIDSGYKIAYVAEATVQHSHKFTAQQVFRRYYALGAAFERVGLGGAERGPRLTGTGLRYATAEIAWTLRHHGLAWALRSVVYSASKGAGYALGRHQRRLPSFIQRALQYRPRTDVVSPLVPQKSR